MIVIGKLVASILGLSELLGTNSGWSILLLVPLIPAFAHLFLIIAPESPKHLYINLNKQSEARDGIVFIIKFNFQT